MLIHGGEQILFRIAGVLPEHNASHMPVLNLFELVFYRFVVVISDEDLVSAFQK
jgi:hypothetical protein